MQTKDELIVEIGNNVVNDENYTGRDWSAISLVGKFKGLNSRLQGYVYESSGKWEAEIPNAAVELKDTLSKLRETMQNELGGDPWKTCLVQIKRKDQSVNIKFEYDDENEWSRDLPTLHERLRPE